MEYKSADSISEVFVSTDLDNLPVAHSQNLGGSPNTDIQKKCPVCKAAERYFSLNLDEKILLCENPECDYPFGYTELQFITQDETCHTANKADSTNVVSRQVPPGSTNSSNTSLAIHCSLETYDLKDTRQKTDDSNEQDRTINPEAAFNIFKPSQTDVEVKAEIQHIKKLKNKIQKKYQKEQISYISKKEYIQHLKKLQGSNGDLVKTQEISRIQPDAPAAPVDTSAITFEILQQKKKRKNNNDTKKRPGVGPIQWISSNSLYGGRL